MWWALIIAIFPSRIMHLTVHMYVHPSSSRLCFVFAFDGGSSRSWVDQFRHAAFVCFISQILTEMLEFIA